MKNPHKSDLMNRQDDNIRRFEDIILPHLDAAYNYARWIVKNDAAAQDIVQESCIRAFKGFHRYADGNGRAWLLKIVRHESYDWLGKFSGHGRHVNIDDEEYLSPEDRIALGHQDTPERNMTALQDKALLEQALLEIPEEFREVLILKELEEMSYLEIAKVINAPIGTVMSRLSRGRAKLRTILTGGRDAKD